MTCSPLTIQTDAPRLTLQDLATRWKVPAEIVDSVYMTAMHARESALADGATLLLLTKKMSRLLNPSTADKEWIGLMERREIKVAQLTAEIAQLSIDIASAEETKNKAAAEFGEASKAHKTAEGEKRTLLNRNLPILQKACSSTRDQYEKLLRKRESLSTELEKASRLLKSAKETCPEILLYKDQNTIDREMKTVEERLARTRLKVDTFMRKFVKEWVDPFNRPAAERFFIELSRPTI